jgi:hypothetical protein
MGEYWVLSKASIAVGYKGCVKTNLMHQRVWIPAFAGMFKFTAFLKIHRALARIIPFPFPAKLMIKSIGSLTKN